MPSGVEYLPLVDSLCQAFCAWTGMSRDVTDDMAIAVVEAATNAVVHGNKCDRSKKVQVVLQAAARRDRGLGRRRGPRLQSRPAVANPLEAANMLKECGRGIYIMKHIMDKVDFDFPTEGGTRVRMTQVPHLRQGPGAVRGLRREAPGACPE